MKTRPDILLSFYARKLRRLIGRMKKAKNRAEYIQLRKAAIDTAAYLLDALNRKKITENKQKPIDISSKISYKS